MALVGASAIVYLFRAASRLPCWTPLNVLSNLQCAIDFTADSLPRFGPSAASLSSVFEYPMVAAAAVPSPLPPPGDLLLLIDDLVERFNLDRSCDTALRCSASAQGCFQVVGDLPGLQLERAANPPARVIKELNKAGALIHGQEGSKSPKSGIVGWLDRITDRDRPRAISELSVAMVMVMIDEFVEEYRLDYSCEKALKFSVPCTEVAAIVYTLASRDHAILKSSHNPSAYVMKELRGKTITGKVQQQQQQQQEQWGQQQQQGRPMDRRRPPQARERSRTPPGRGPPLSGFDAPPMAGRFGGNEERFPSSKGGGPSFQQGPPAFMGKGSGKGFGKGGASGPPPATQQGYGNRDAAPPPRRSNRGWD